MFGQRGRWVVPGSTPSVTADATRPTPVRTQTTVDLSWLALLAPIVALPALAGAARLEDLATEEPRERGSV